MLVLHPVSLFAVELPCSYPRGKLCIHVDRSDNLKRPRPQKYGATMVAGGEVRFYFWENKVSQKTIDVSQQYNLTTNLFMKGVCGMEKFYSLTWKEDAYGKYLSGGTYVMKGEYSIRLMVQRKAEKDYYQDVLYNFSIPFE